MTTVGIGLCLILLSSIHVSYVSYRKEGDKDLLATISTAVKNLSDDQITDDVPIKDSFLLVLQTPQQQKWLVQYATTRKDNYTPLSNMSTRSLVPRPGMYMRLVPIHRIHYTRYKIMYTGMYTTLNVYTFR